MSSPEVERFEVTEDDLQNEFNPYRKQFRQTKHQATYGIWADEDSDEERPSFGGSGGRNKKDYTAPMNFVSGGIKVGDKVEKVKSEDGADNISDSDEEEMQMANRYGKQRGRPAFRGSAYKNIPGQRDGSSGQGGIGSWEVHTTGIASKIMAKMGFKKGTGLGKTGQGISTPVEAKLRRGKGAIGFYGSERTERSLKDFPVQPDSDEEEEKQFKEQLQQWKKSDGENKKKPKYVYKTADEVIATGGKKKTVVQSDLAKVKVIDMTGREKRVLSGYHAISQKHDKPDEDESMDQALTKTPGKPAFEMPELMHNLDLLVDMAEDEILQNNKKLQYERDLVVNLKHEKEKLDEVCKNEEQQLNTLEEIMNTINKCEARTAPGVEDPLTLEECAKLFSHLQNDFYEEYKIYDLATVGVALVFPLMKREFEGWDPLSHPRHGLGTMREWREILEGPNQGFGGKSGSEEHMDPYERLMWEVWMPHIRTTINSRWSVRDCDALIEVLEAWLPLLPKWILFNVLEQLILPRLQAEVISWNPLTDTMPIHAWLHPWLPLMGDRLEPLYAPIRHKLSNALTNWHPSDPSAKMILQPWAKVFQQGHMDAFMVKNIAPKLGLCLAEFVINPHQQHLDAWTWVMSWLDMVPLPAMVNLLEKNFFPRWHQVLCSWLASNPNYDEVTKWYTGWKSMVPENLLSHPTVKEQFNRALDTMNRAVSGTQYQPGARENVAYLTSTERRRDYESPYSYSAPPPPPPAPPQMAPPPMPPSEIEMHGARGLTASSSVPTSFKELIERKAEENNVVFVPLVGKTFEAKQVYQFGRLHIVIDRGVLFMQQENGQWIPVSLQTIIDRGR